MKYLFLAIFTLVSFISNAQRWNGLSLIARMNQSSITLIDTNGTVQKTWNFTGTLNGYSCYLMPGGILWRSVKGPSGGLLGGGMTGRIQKVDWNGNILFDWTYSSTTYCLHHDICPMPNGNILVISYDVKSTSEVLAAGSNFNQAVWSEKIMEIQPTGLSTYNVVWEWKVWDHLMQNTNASAANYVSSLANNPQLFNLATITGPSSDWLHMNGIDYDPSTDLISLSSHNTDEVFIIDHSTTTAQAASHAGGTYGKGGDLLYRYGNPNNYSAAGSQAINVVHDAHFIKNGPRKGGLSFFNNQGISGSASSVDHIILPKVGNSFTVTAGSAYSPSTYSYRLNPSGFSSNMSNSEEYPNGNIMVCLATGGDFKEFDSTGALVWSFTGTGSMPQVHRYTNCEISGNQPTKPTISVNAGNASVTALNGASYQWYIDGILQTSATTNTIPLGNYGSYQAIVIDSFGCASTISDNYNYWTTNISGVEKNNISISPNPANSFISISFKHNIQNYICEIKDINGKIVSKTTNQDKIDIAHLADGNYYLEIKQNNKTLYKSQFNHTK